jgi:hypothetical protein
MSPLIDERLAGPSDPPSVSEERDARKLHGAKILAWLEAGSATADELRKITPHYQQRISELRQRGYCIENVPQWIVLADGRKLRRDGGYRLRSQTPQGPPADAYRTQPRLIP